MSITGEQNGPSMKVGVAITDLFTGLYATIAIQSALAYRAKTGEGQEIDMALYDAQIAMLANVASNVLIGGKDAPKFGNEHPNIVPYQLFATKNGEVIVTVGNDHQFEAFCDAFGLSTLTSDERFHTNTERVNHREGLIKEIEKHIAGYETHEVMEKLTRVGVPCGPVRSVKQAILSEETKARDMIWQVDHPLFGMFNLVASPLKLSKTPPKLHMAPPTLGEHTREILIEQGFLEQEIQDYMAKGVVISC